jgi:tetratricopeptide (TPR) repeat protein
MSLKDIEKLKERVEKDPNSKLFVPLAEEYRKEGMLEEAINVLMSGLERQPGYMSARVSLGKIFLEKGMTSEARSEFESVIKSIPDNLYAHKKLAEIYRDLGQKELSIRSYKTVLKLSTFDEEALSNLRDLEEEELRGVAEPFETDAGLLSGEEAGETVSEEAFHEEEAQAVPHEAEAPAAIYAEDLSAFKDSIFGDTDAAGDVEVVEETPHETADSGEEELIEVVEEEPVAEDEEMSFADIDPFAEEPLSADTVTVVEEAGVRWDIPADAGEKIVSPGSAGDRYRVEDADRFIADGDYLRALEVYRNILSSDPDNRTALQRAEELRALLKLMGTDKDALIARLNAFLEGITKRRNEFHGRS